MKRKQLLAAVLAFAVGASSFAADRLPDLSPLDVSKARPTLEEVGKARTGTTADGYQLKMIGEKFALVATSDGQPIVVFDTSLQALGWSEILLGGIGFGDLTLLKLVQKLRKSKGLVQDANDVTHEAEDAELAALMEATRVKNHKKAMKNGMKLFKDLRMTEEWAARNGIEIEKGKKEHGVAFQYADFTMADISLPNDETRSKVFTPMIGLAKVLYPSREWTLETIKEFAKEFQFRLRKDKKNPGYDVYWSQLSRGDESAARRPKLPGFAVNFVNPYASLSYKYQLRQLDQYGEVLAYQLGIVGVLMDLVLSNVTHHLAERVDYHERQLLGLLEANARFEYDSGLPLDLVDVMIDLIYLSRFRGSGDEQMTDGPYKRKAELAFQEANRPKALARINKLVSKRNLSISEVGGGKFALAFETGSNGETGKFRGIYGLGLKPTKVTKRPSLHVNARGPGMKIAERYVGETLGFLLRTMLPGYWGFRIGQIFYFQIRIPPAVYQYWARKRGIEERELEGELVGLLEEASQGRYSGLALSATDIKFARNQLRQTTLNPYELSAKDEPRVMEANLRLIKEIIAGGNLVSQIGDSPVPVAEFR